MTSGPRRSDANVVLPKSHSFVRIVGKRSFCLWARLSHNDEYMADESVRMDLAFDDTISRGIGATFLTFFTFLAESDPISDDDIPSHSP